jgi:predicted PurR-regulated permease PerM
MNKLARYIIIGMGLSIVLFLLWYFSHIVAYILVAAVLSLVGKPIVDLVCKISIRGWSPPKMAGAAVALVSLWLLFILFFRVMIPLVISQVNELSTVNVPGMVASFSQPISDFDAFIKEYLPVSARNFSTQDLIVDKVTGMFHVGIVSQLFSSTATLLGNLVIAAFSITFITFFFLKDEGLFFEGLVVLFPEKFETNIKHAIISINRLLRRYFIGIVIQSIAIMLLNTLGLTIVGIGFQTALVIGLFTGILNVIPYVGPLAGILLGTLIGLATNLQLDFTTGMLPLMGYMLIVFTIVQLIDNFVFQPLIFSNSVNAHPLEIFIVLLIAGSLGGILGMLLAIPGYTVLRVFAKEFFNKFRLVQKLTEKI